jgi:CRISPR system Cascade subunit CasB
MPELHPFVAYLQGLAEKEERGALAALRRGLGQPPGTVPAMYPYVVPWLPQEGGAWREAPYYHVAALFALHPAAGGSGNLGAAFRLARGDEENEAVERRFTALLAAHPDDLPDYLRQAVGFLRSKDVAIDWDQLFQDIQHWGLPTRMVQKKWAGAFWGRVDTNRDQAKDHSQA